MSFAIVVGGAGALGSAILSEAKKHEFITVCVDLKENPEADKNVLCSDNTLSDINQLLGQTPHSARLIVNAAGGWAGGNLNDAEFATKCRQMWEMNVESSILTALIAAAHLSSNGYLFLVGANAVAAHATPEMLAYGMSKAAVSNLAANLSKTEKSGLPSTSQVTLLLPEVLLTEANKKAMPGADTSKWTDPVEIAQQLMHWINDSAQINGHSYHIETRAGATKFIKN